MTQDNIMLADEVATQAKESDAKLQVWLSRFNRAENFRKPHIARMQRMYKIYRAYRTAKNYAYHTKIMPPIGFQIVETIKPRLASAHIDISLTPKKKNDAKSEFIQEWDSLVGYDLSVIGLNDTSFDDLKIWWINAMLIYGNGTIQLSWDGGKPYAEVVDNYLLYVDPQATNRLLDSGWEIKQTFKDKALILKDEKSRPERELYFPDKLKKVDNISISNDPRTQRSQINTLRMGMIDDGKKEGQATDAGAGTENNDKNLGAKLVEIWECFDHVTDRLVVIMNREYVVRDETNPYIKIRGGRTFYDLPAISLNWEYYAMSHLEPVETTIYEMADSRNQAMDDIVFSLDPIVKVKKGKGYKPSDFKHAPHAFWELDNVNDIALEVGPRISQSWVEKDDILQKSIQGALALSEYTQGIPNSAQEPANKVELLLMQTNIRFSLLLRQMKITMKDMVDSIIEMNQEFLAEEFEYRITGDTSPEWKKFTMGAKDVTVDATVDIQPTIEKSAAQESNETISLYQALVTEEIPLIANASPEQVQEFDRRKRVLQKMLVRAFGKGEYIDEIMGPDKKTQDNPPKVQQPTQVTPQQIPVQQGNSTVPPILNNPPQAPIPTMPVETGGTGSNPRSRLARLLLNLKR